MIRLVVLLALLINLSACATWQKETLAYMGGAFAGGAALGALQSPRGDDPAMHGLLWGSVASAAVGATLVYLYDENRIIREKENEINSLKVQLSENKMILEEGTSQFLEQELPVDLTGLVEPGSWSLYEVDEWKQSKKGEYTHVDKILEIKPAKLKMKK